MKELSWTYGATRHEKTGKGSKDPRAKMVGVPKPMRDALVAVGRKARKEAKSLRRSAKRKTSQNWY